MDEITIPEAPALIIRPGRDEQARRWRAVLTHGYALGAGAMFPVESRGEGETRADAVDALLRPLCESGELGSGSVLVQLIELDAEDDVPEFWAVRMARAATGEWVFTLESQE